MLAALRYTQADAGISWGQTLKINSMRRGCPYSFIPKASGADPANRPWQVWGQTLRRALFSKGTDPLEVVEANNFRENCQESLTNF